MPEAPEVYNYYQFIYPKLINKSVYNICILSGKYTKKQPENYKDLLSLLPSKIIEINLHGKLIFVVLENNFVIEFSHGMTGFWNVVKEKHSRIEIDLNNTSLYFEDPRNFARLNIYTKIQYVTKLNNLGPKVLDINADFNEFYNKIIKKKNSKISLCLLDQSILSGIGNYLRCDVLWYSQINPDVKVKELSIEKLEELFKNCIEISRFFANLPNNLKKQPIRWDKTINSWVSSNFVYMQEYDIFGNKVHKKKIGSRTVHFVEF